MTEYLTFNFKYKEAYTSVIEFVTQINEKHKGREQRYPKWTYPKRIFTLKFDKNFEGRQALEEFFINTMQNGGKFLWTWAEDKGGNNKTYLCFFEDEKFKQNIKNLGYTECELGLVCIDDTPFTEVGEFNFYHTAECEHSLEFYRLMDSAFTAANNLKIWWSLPKRTWTLKFDKDPVARRQLEEFFIAKRGRFRSFDWTWEKSRGGDGKTYHVRFDSDTLQMDVDQYGYATLQIQLTEVFRNENPYNESEKDELIPRKLLNIEYGNGAIRILDNETLQSVTYNGEEYLGAPLSHGEIMRDDNSSVSKLNISLSNIALSISGLIGTYGDVLTNAPAVLTLVFLNVNTNTLIPGLHQVLYAGKCNNINLDYNNASMDIETPLGGYEKQAPVMKYRSNCQVRRFKDCRCGYSGVETTCDRTWDRCKELGNQKNFRGFPTMYEELVIKV